ncbi:MAG: TRAP transporter small permease [Salinarimonadaceae bacterium]|nr:MAG: TRAP transporter small permease [Salinarimonadaceae bacterium]
MAGRRSQTRPALSGQAMRRFLLLPARIVGWLVDAMCRASVALAALAMIALAVTIMIQIVARFTLTSIAWTTPIAGYALVATTFLAIAPALRANVHIRVSLFIEKLTGRARTIVEAWCHGLGFLLSVYCTWWTTHQTFESHRFNERSTDIIPFALWPYQALMAWGFALFSLVLLERILAVASGLRSSWDDGSAPAHP